MAGPHLLVQLLDSAVEGRVAVLLVHVVVSSPALVAHPDAKVLDGGGLLLEDLRCACSPSELPMFYMLIFYMFIGSTSYSYWYQVENLALSQEIARLSMSGWLIADIADKELLLNPLPTSLQAKIWPLAFFTRLSFLRKYLRERILFNLREISHRTRVFARTSFFRDHDH